MLLSLFIAAGIVVSGFASTWMGIELAFYPPQSDKTKWKVRFALSGSLLILLALTLWATMRGEEAMRDLPRQVAEYLRLSVKPDQHTCHVENNALADCTSPEVLSWGDPLLERLNAAVKKNENRIIQRHEQYQRDHDEKALQNITREASELNRYLESEYQNLTMYRAALLSKLKGGDPDPSAAYLYQSVQGPLRDNWPYFDTARMILENLTALRNQLAQQIKGGQKIQNTPPTINNAQNGIANSGTINGSPSVTNNYAPPPPQCSVTKLSDSTVQSDGSFNTEYELDLVSASSVSSLFVRAESPSVKHLMLSPGSFTSSNDGGPSGVYIRFL